MEIRKHEKSDEAEIIQLLRLNTPKYFSPEEETDLVFYFENHAHNYYVCIIDGQIVGSGGYNLSEDGKVGKISWDIIHPDRQGMGIGSELTKFRIEQIKKIAGITHVSVRTSQLVYKFYERFGLKLREVAKDYWAEGFDMYRLDRNIKEV